MKTLQATLLLSLLLSGLSGCASRNNHPQGNNRTPGTEISYAIQMADAEMTRNPEPWMLDFSKAPKWNYCHGLELQVLLQVGEATGNPKYFDYAYAYADTMVLFDGTIRTYRPQEYNIDRINPGKLLFMLYHLTREERFKLGIISMREQMRSHPRTSQGSFWHKQVYPHQVWLDGIYMASPFLAQYALEFNEPALFDDVVLQITDVRDYLYNPETGLYYHGWDESREQAWADKETGCSTNFWSRAIGWYLMAMVDVLDFLPQEHPRRREVIALFSELCEAVGNFRDPETGMWYQVTDRVGEAGNYLEATGSAMFIYSWVKGAQKSYLDESYLDRGATAYRQYLDTFVYENEGLLSIRNCCAVAGLGGTERYRDGSYEYYLSEPMRDNDPKAVSPFMMVSLLLGN